MLGKTLKILRNYEKLTVRAAAIKLGISHTHLCNVENSKVKTSLDLIEKLNYLYGVNVMVVDYLLNVDLVRLPLEVRGSTRILASLYRSKYEDKRNANGSDE